MEELEDKDRLQAIKTTISKLEKEYGKGVVMKLSENEVDKVPSISTGSLSLDLALGIGGLPRGRIIEIFGPESSGKTTLSMHCIVEAQKLGDMQLLLMLNMLLINLMLKKLVLI